MKISIWQQFSSNHSGSFTVVGKFPSIEEAQKAEAEIWHHLGEIQAWWRHLSDDEAMEWRNKTRDKELTPVEADLAKHYGVDWEYAIEYIDSYSPERALNRRTPVQHYENFVIITSPHDAFNRGPQPFNIWLKALGAEVHSDVYDTDTHPFSDLYIDVTFLCVDETTGQTIEQAIQGYFSAELNDYYPPPWIAYYNGSLHANASNLKRLALILWKRSCVHSRVYKLNPGLSQLTSKGKVNHEVWQQIFRFERLLFSPLVRFPEEDAWVRQALFITKAVSQSSEVMRDGLKLTVKGLHPNSTSIHEFMRAFTAWLKAQGCTEIEFSFREVQ